MSANSKFMDTEIGGEQTQYESQSTSQTPHKKSAGQLGSSSEHTTTDPSSTEEGIQAQKARGQQTAENLRYGQTVSEGGMSGFTNGTSSGEGGAEEVVDGRRVAGYAGGNDVGA
ncbi:hypothetical protein AC578_1432 [Pseudocercospora eumusae]|uniref:Uncharacterized protein n=1 Tax=Pseudocercospora eumusae TaxID=321146 RepID=A0A139HUV4_9PEZI|nr:hypothetical protein AC578_1432 [Pseudocercospora eumusae]